MVRAIDTRKSLAQFKMSVANIPTITTLLRASRNQDEDILNMVLQNIIKNGVSEADLNATDCNGRVSEISIRFRTVE